MAQTQKLTITLLPATLAAVRAQVQAGAAASVSGFVQHAVAVALDDLAGWQEALALALEETGGPLSASEQAWAERVVTRGETAGAA